MGGYEGIWARKTISIGRNFGIVLGFEWRSEQHQRTNWISEVVTNGHNIDLNSVSHARLRSL